MGKSLSDSVRDNRLKKSKRVTISNCSLNRGNQRRSIESIQKGLLVSKLEDSALIPMREIPLRRKGRIEVERLESCKFPTVKRVPWKCKDLSIEDKTSPPYVSKPKWYFAGNKFIEFSLVNWEEGKKWLIES